jgi:hypothetical protein
MVSKAMRAAACPAAPSRTMAPSSTSPPQPATACTPRAAGRVAMPAAQLAALRHKDGERRAEPAAARTCWRLGVQQLAAGDAEQVQRDRQLYRAA